MLPNIGLKDLRRSGAGGYEPVMQRDAPSPHRVDSPGAELTEDSGSGPSAVTPASSDSGGGPGLGDVKAGPPGGPSPAVPGVGYRRRRLRRSVLVGLATAVLVALLVALAKLAADDGYVPAFWRGVLERQRAGCRGLSESGVPQYFQTSPELWAGPTVTGKPALLAQTAVVQSASGMYVPNAPLETSMPIIGMGQNDSNVFRGMGNLSPYSPSPGFGVDEHPLPDGAKIVQVHMLSRHGSRYPTSGSNVEAFGARIAKARAAGNLSATDSLAFLNNWSYQLGAEILVPKGRQELFDSGVLHAYMYGRLYDPSSKIIIRTTTEDRMLRSAENWAAGFFGLEWTNNATIEVIIEAGGFNNSLAGSTGCRNSGNFSLGSNAASAWISHYLRDATVRLQGMVKGYDWTYDDTYAAQTMCPYETVAFGYSVFCKLFTYEEWQGFEYSLDLGFFGNSGFGSPTGRATGLGYQQELLARLRNTTFSSTGSQANQTLDGNSATFPLNQTLYFDFTHDDNIVAVLAAMGMRQFSGPLPTDKIPAGAAHNFVVSHLTPFGARLDLEVIKTPRSVPADRAGYAGAGSGEAQTYVHMLLNQRTVPLGRSLPQCDAARVDGWCTLEAFVAAQQAQVARAQFAHACFGSYPAPKYGDVTDGAPTA